MGYTYTPATARNKTPHTTHVKEIRDVIVSLLDRCDLPWPTVEYDWSFDAECRAEAIRRGFPMDGRNSLVNSFPGGVVMASNTFGHLPNRATKIFLAVYTAALIYIDDISESNASAVRSFNERFVSQKPHGDTVLDCFSTMLKEFPEHFDKVAANIMITSTLNLVTATVLEQETQGMEIKARSHLYPSFCRVLSGAAEAFALFVFPPEIPLSSYIQIIPEMAIYINYTNDILSFYKEELAGDSVNYVSLLAAQRNCSKLKALWHVSDLVVDSHTRTLKILEGGNEAAFNTYKAFSVGYLGFHAGIPRYKLKELEL